MKQKKNVIFRHCKNKIYYFDKAQICRVISINEATNMYNNKKLIGMATRRDGSIYIVEYEFICHYNIREIETNLVKVKMALTKLKEGDSFDIFLDELKKVELKKHEKPKEVYAFVTRVEKPIIERCSDNENVKTFDFVKVRVNILRNKGKEEKYKLINKYLDEIKKMVIEKIILDKNFLSYEVPISFLKLTNISLTVDSSLLFTFELKELEEK